MGEKLIGQCFDIPHAFIRGEDPIAFLKSFDGDLQSIHLSDCTSEKDAHLPFNSDSILPLDDILKTLKKKQYDGIINLELLPRTLLDLRSVINSYLKVIKVFDKKKYFSVRVKLVYYMPQLLKMFKNKLN